MKISMLAVFMLNYGGRSLRTSEQVMGVIKGQTEKSEPKG